MQPTLHPADTYLLVLTRRDATELLLVREGRGWALPRVDVQPHQRIAPQLTSATSTIWGIEAYCSFISSLSAQGRPRQFKCAVMESVGQNDQAPAGALWVSRSRVESCVEESTAMTIRATYDELDDYAKNSARGHFAKPGWLRELFEWTQAHIDPWNLKLTGRFDQLNASPTFSLIRMETNRVAVWFKATGEPNTRELCVTTTLARLFPADLPIILAIHEEWNGWLLQEVIGDSLAETKQLSMWEQAAEEFAELQIASIPRVGELLHSQFKDLRIPTLAEKINPFLTRVSDFMAVQEKVRPAPLSSFDLESLGKALRACCRGLERMGLPATVGHVDLNPGNILISRNGCVFLDWAEGCVIHPLLPLHYLIEHLARTCSGNALAANRLTTAYLRPWRCFYAAKELKEGLSLARILAVFAYAVATDSWRSVDPAQNPTLAGYFRSLTRRMHSDACHLLVGSEPCPN